MRQYVVDELRPAESKRIEEYLNENSELSDITGLYWVNIPEVLYSGLQAEHQECKPYSAAIELRDEYVKMEMLIRSRNKIRCKCIAFATKDQRDFLLEFMDKLIEETDIKV
jgi:hypothetical protein